MSCRVAKRRYYAVLYLPFCSSVSASDRFRNTVDNSFLLLLLLGSFWRPVEIVSGQGPTVMAIPKSLRDSIDDYVLTAVGKAHQDVLKNLYERGNEIILKHAKEMSELDTKFSQQKKDIVTGQKRIHETLRLIDEREVVIHTNTENRKDFMRNIHAQEDNRRTQCIAEMNDIATKMKNHLAYAEQQRKEIQQLFEDTKAIMEEKDDDQKQRGSDLVMNVSKKVTDMMAGLEERIHALESGSPTKYEVSNEARVSADLRAVNRIVDVQERSRHAQNIARSRARSESTGRRYKSIFEPVSPRTSVQPSALRSNSPPG